MFPLLPAFRRDVLGFPERDQGAEQFTPVPVIQAGPFDQQALHDQAMIAGFAFGVFALTEELSSLELCGPSPIRRPFRA